MVGSAKRDRSNQSFDRPAVLDETRCQVIEQLRVRRFFTEGSEVRRRVDQSATKVVQPDAIDDDASHQRVPAVRQKLRIAQSPSGRWNVLVVKRNCLAEVEH